jgi:hypothetical protein
MKVIAIPVLALLLACTSVFAQATPPLQQYLIEREIKGAGAALVLMPMLALQTPKRSIR